MSNSAGTLTTTCNAIEGGLDAVDGVGEEFLFGFTGAFLTNDQVTLIFTDALSGFQTYVGGGYASGVQPNFCYTFNNRIFTLAGSQLNFCAIGLPTTWNDPNAAGNGYVVMNNYYSSPATLQAIAPYQGKLMFACRDYCQIWNIDPDPANFAAVQTLPNIGTIAPDSVKAVGDMDVYMLYDSGVRSIRVRDASNNAIIADIGTPVDSLIQSVLVTLTDAQKAAACGVVDPSANRYWLYIPTAADNPSAGITGSIYVFSYFTSSQVAAWSTYAPTYQTQISPIGGTYPFPDGQLTFISMVAGTTYYWSPGPNEISLTYNGVKYVQPATFVGVTGQTQAVAQGSTSGFSPYTGSLSTRNWFVPQKFEIFQGQVWVRDTQNNVYQYGGANNQAYENCTVTATMPFIDSGLPGNIKTYGAIDAAFQGSWSINVATDYLTAIFKNVFNGNLSTFRRQRINYEARSTHYAFQAVENGAGYARFSSAIMHIKGPPQGNEKV